MNIGIIGVGLIGGSLGLALKQSTGHTVRGYDCNPSTRKYGVHCVDGFSDSIKELAAESDLLVIATPIDMVREVLSELKSYHAVITDVSSVKIPVMQDAALVYGKIPPHFVPAHPIAGREISGAQAARADLYTGRQVILTPTAETDSAAVNQVKALWQGIGASIEYMEADEHDRIFALSSHLPHILAYALVNCLHRGEEHDKIGRYAASGFRGLTRIAASKPELWSAICLSNREYILTALQSFNGELEQIRQALETQDGQCLQQIFEESNWHKKNLDDANIVIPNE